MTHKIVVENVSSQTQRAWTTFGLPDTVAVKGACTAVTPDGRVFPLLVNGNTAHLRAELKGFQRVECKVDLTQRPLPPFTFSPWITDEPWRNVPRFYVVLNGQRLDSLPTPFLAKEGDAPNGIWIESQDQARIVYQFRTLIPGANLHMEGWLYVYSDQEVIEFEINATYGTENDPVGTPKNVVFGTLGMIVGEKPVIDHRIPKGLHAPMWRTDIVPGQLHWEAELCAPMQWLRCRTVEVTGALLCLPNESKFGQLPGDPRVANLKAREEAGIFAIADVWDGEWSPFGVIPRLSPSQQYNEINRRRTDWLRRENTPGHEMKARPYAQPPSSGQTGEQPDFGAARCEHALATLEPWALHDLRYCVQAWMLRPYAHRNADGTMAVSTQHPGAQFWNLRPDERFGSDMLGWPKPVGWIGDWDTSDSQHRSDNMLLGMFALTRSKSLELRVRDILNCQEMELYRPQTTIGTGLGTPRNMRVLQALCYAYKVGFKYVEPIIRRMVADAWKAASFRNTTPSDDIRVLSLNEDKYGWTTPDGRLIRAWLTWQEGIAGMAFYAAWRLFQLPEALDLCLIPARTIAKHGYFQEADKWYCCYAVRVNDANPYDALPDASYNLNTVNYDVFVYGIHRWSLGVLQILARHEPKTPAGERAAKIVSYFAVQNFDDACWRAV